MRLLKAIVGPLPASSATSIVATTGGSTAANTPFTLTSIPYVQSFPCRVLITSAGTDTGISFTITGTDWNGQTVSEKLTGGSSGSPVQSVYDYATITSVVPSGATASTNSVGTNGVGSCRPLFLDEYAPAPTSIQVVVTGTVSATVQQSLDDPNGSQGYTGMTWINHPDTNLVNLSTSVQGNYAYLPKVSRILLNSGSGTVTIKLIQAGITSAHY